MHQAHRLAFKARDAGVNFDQFACAREFSEHQARFNHRAGWRR